MPDYSFRYLNDGKALFLQEEDYVGEIKGGLRPTMRLVVMGIVHKQPKRFVSDTCLCLLQHMRSFVHCHIRTSWMTRFIEDETRLHCGNTMSQLYRGLYRFNVSSSDRSKRKHGCQQRTLDIDLILNACRKTPISPRMCIYVCVYNISICIYVKYVFLCKYIYRV